VLVVDDDEIVLASLKSLLTLDTEYEVFTFQSPVEALEVARDLPVDVVISDFLMPDLNGLEFLARLKRIYPDVPRILLTGYADKGSAIEAINEIGLFQYIEKPWDNDNLKLILRNSLESRGLQERLKRKLDELDELLRRHDALSKREDLMRQELKLAQQVQLNLFPGPIPEHNGYRFAAKYKPAFEIGGDYYDVQPLGDGRLAVLIADATGHGIQAALSTSLLKFAFTSHLPLADSPGEMLKGMNEILCQGLPENTFIAATIAVLDTNAHKALIVNAGLPHPFILRRSTRKVERIAINGLFIGLDLPGGYDAGETVELEFNRGDCLLMLTDGISEMEDPSGAFFGDSELVPALQAALHESVESIVETLHDAALMFKGSSHSPDDITIVGVETVRYP
jgi:sigma-B regulation protein RsbU (phosphoserine phosphatase)